MKRVSAELVGVPERKHAAAQAFGGEETPGVVLGDAIPYERVPVGAGSDGELGAPGLELGQKVGGEQRAARLQCRPDEDGRNGEQREEGDESPGSRRGEYKQPLSRR